MELNENNPKPEGATPAKKTSKAKIIGIICGFLALGVAGAALAFAFLLGGGPQPEDILPRDTVAIAKIDFDPKIGQRVNLVRFLSKFPNTLENFDEEDPIGSLLKQSELTSEIDWESVKPWIGNRFAVAILESANELKPVLVLSVTDVEEMEYYFLKNYPELDYEVISDFVVIADSKSVVNLVVNAPSHLAENEKYLSDMETLGGDQIASIWADLRPIDRLFRDYFNGNIFYEGAFEEISNASKISNGRIGIGMHFTPNAFVTDLVTINIGSTDGADEYRSKSLEVLGGLPSSAIGAVSIEGIKETISTNLFSLSEVVDLIDSIGLRETEITTLFDGPVVLMALDRGLAQDPLFVVRLQPNDPSAVILSLRKFFGRNQLDLSEIDNFLFVDSEYLYFGEDVEVIRSTIEREKSSGARLGDSELFQNTMTSYGNLSAFIDLAKLLPRLDIDTKGAPLAGMGLVAGADPDVPGVTRASLVISVN